MRTAAENLDRYWFSFYQPPPELHPLHESITNESNRPAHNGENQHGCKLCAVKMKYHFGYLNTHIFFQIPKQHLLLQLFPARCSIIPPSCITEIINLVPDNSTAVDGIKNWQDFQTADIKSNVFRLISRTRSPANCSLGLRQSPVRSGFPAIFSTRLYREFPFSLCNQNIKAQP